MTPQELLDAWHVQQNAYIEFREQRTRAMVDVLAALTVERGRDLRVLDLGCGPGSLGEAVLQRLPGASVVGVDRDPILLRLGRDTNRHGERQVFVDADLAGPDWVAELSEGAFDAAVSATALHWLDPEHLAGLYQRLAGVMNPGGVVMNADHLLFDAAHDPFLHHFAEREREQIRLAHLDAGAMTWDDWWQAALTMPSWQAEADLWRERWATKHATVKVGLEFHLSALRAAGFTQTAQIYQWFDDRIVFGRLPQA